MIVKNQVLVSKKEKFSVVFVLDDCNGRKKSLVPIQRFDTGEIKYVNLKDYRLPYGNYEVPKEIRQYCEENGIKPIVQYQEQKIKKLKKLKIVL